MSRNLLACRYEMIECDAKRIGLWAGLWKFSEPVPSDPALVFFILGYGAGLQPLFPSPLNLFLGQRPRNGACGRSKG